MRRIIILDTESKRLLNIILSPGQEKYLSEEINNDIDLFIKEIVVKLYHINYVKCAYITGDVKDIKEEHYYGPKVLDKV
jgi:hypothetical protein